MRKAISCCLIRARTSGSAKRCVLFLIQCSERVELGAAIVASDACWIAQVQHRVALTAKQNALMIGGKKSGPPQSAEQTLLGVVAFGVHDDVARQVLVHAAEPVAEPRSETRTSRYLTAGLNVRDRGVVIDRLSKRAVHDAQVFRDRRCVWEKLADPDASIVVFLPGEFVFRRTDGERFLSGGHAGDALSVANVFGQVLSGHLLHFGFVVPQIVMGGSAAHEQIDHAFGFRGVMHAFQRGGGVFFTSEHSGAEQLCYRCRAQPKRTATKQLPTGQIQFVFTKRIRVVHERLSSSVTVNTIRS